MIRFASDYQEGAHPAILQKMLETNLTQTPGYGEDEFCEEAREMIRRAMAAPQADVHFLVGGTQTNFTFLAAALKPWQGAACCESGHIAVHESGAVEATGHKVLTLPAHDGKVAAEELDEMCRAHFSDETHEHMVMPGALYISDSTEIGTVYTRAELTALRAVCDKWKLVMYLDGARLGYALSARGGDVDLPFLAKTCDAFYIGGTKQGALFGEALVILREDLKNSFRYLIKQRGAMLAKGRLLGIQFAELFRNGLYFTLSEHAVHEAMRIREALLEMGCPLMADSPTNQIFPILPDRALAELQRDFAYSYIRRVDDQRSAIRLCTSWATRPEDVDQLIQRLREM